MGIALTVIHGDVGRHGLVGAAIVLRVDVRVRVCAHGSPVELRGRHLLKVDVHRRLGCRIFVATCESGCAFSIARWVLAFVTRL